MVTTIGGMMLGWVLAPNYLQEVHGISLERIGWLGSIAALGSTLLSLGVSRIRWLGDPFHTLLIAIAAVAGGFTLLLLGSDFRIFLVAYLLRGGFLVAWSAFYAVFGVVTREHLRSRVFALAEILGGLGTTVAPFVAGPLYEIDARLPLALGLGLSALLVVATRMVHNSIVQRQSTTVPVR